MLFQRRNGKTRPPEVEAQPVELRVSATIRLATEEDIPRLEWFGQFTHFRRLFQETYQQQLQGRRLMLVADVNGFPVGQVFVSLEAAFLNFSGAEPQGYLYALRVMEPFQRLGLGTALVRAAEQRLRDSGYRSATIAVAKDNEGALRLYSRLGYRIFGEDAGRWSYVDHVGKTCFVEEPCWLMEKLLEAGSSKLDTGSLPL